MVNLLGFDLGSTLMPPAPDNPRGFWENQSIVSSHERILTALGMRWDYIRPFPEDWLTMPAVQKEKGFLTKIISTQINSEHIAIKDPRLCVLLPLWQMICRENNWEANFLFVLRAPADVSHSLLERDRMPLNLGETLWIEYLERAYRQTSAFPRAFISYNNTVDDWRSSLALVQKLPHCESLTRVNIAAELDKFITPKLRHRTTPLFGNDQNLETDLVDQLRRLRDSGADPSAGTNDDWHSNLYTELCRLKIHASGLEIHRSESAKYTAALTQRAEKSEEYAEALTQRAEKSEEYAEALTQRAEKSKEYAEALLARVKYFEEHFICRYFKKNTPQRRSSHE